MISRSGEIGRRSGLKIHRVKAHAGSSPAFGTMFLCHSEGNEESFSKKKYKTRETHHYQNIMEAFSAHFFTKDYQTIFSVSPYN